MAISKAARYYQSKIKNEKIESARLERIRNGSFTIDDIHVSPYDNKYTMLCFNNDLIRVIPVVEGSLLRLYVENNKGDRDADIMLFNQTKQQNEIIQRINQLYKFYYLKLYGQNYRQTSK